MSIILPILNDPRVTVFGNVANPEVFQFKYARVIEETKEVFAVVLRFYEGVEVFGIVTTDPPLVAEE